MSNFADHAWCMYVIEAKHVDSRHAYDLTEWNGRVLFSIISIKMLLNQKEGV